MEAPRCPWCLGDEDYIKYHDKEWGVPLKNDQKLFELLILEGAQAGLSWITILKRRNGYREAFEGMDPAKIALYGQKDIKRLMNDSRIIRNRLKIESAIKNARAYMSHFDGNFAKWLWNWVDGKPILNKYRNIEEIPSSTDLSERISKELKNKGFSFVGPTIIYAFMQSIGMVNDHLVSCFKHSRQKTP